MTQQFIMYKDERGNITPEFTAVIDEVRYATMRKMDQEKPAQEWLTQREAMLFLKIQSRQTMAKLRQNPIIKFKKDGGVFKYNKKSLNDYLNS